MTKLAKKVKAKNDKKIEKVASKVTQKAKVKIAKGKKVAIKTAAVAKELNEASPKKIETKPKQQGIIINNDQLQQAVKALLQLIKMQEKGKSEISLFEDDHPIFVQVVAVKVPRAIPRTLRVQLHHAPRTFDEVCLIVPNLEKQRSKQIEKTTEHYDKLLEDAGIKDIKVLPLYQLFTEYETFEMKRRLLNLYDLFLVDGKISSKVTKFLGKKFIEKRAVPVPVRMEKQNLKAEFDRCMKKASMCIHSRGDNFMSQIGNHHMKPKLLAQNLRTFIDQIQKQFPGGENNIKCINIKSHDTKSIPVYYNLAIKNNVPNVLEAPKRPKKHVLLTDELSTFIDADVTVHPDGTVIKHERSVMGNLEGDLHKDIPTDDAKTKVDTKSKPKKKKAKKSMTKKTNDKGSNTGKLGGNSKISKAKKNKQKKKKIANAV